MGEKTDLLCRRGPPVRRVKDGWLQFLERQEGKKKKGRGKVQFLHHLSQLREKMGRKPFKTAEEEGADVTCRCEIVIGIIGHGKRKGKEGFLPTHQPEGDRVFSLLEGGEKTNRREKAAKAILGGHDQKGNSRHRRFRRKGTPGKLVSKPKVGAKEGKTAPPRFSTKAAYRSSIAVTGTSKKEEKVGFLHPR